MPEEPRQEPLAARQALSTRIRPKTPSAIRTQPKRRTPPPKRCPARPRPAKTGDAVPQRRTPTARMTASRLSPGLHFEPIPSPFQPCSRQRGRPQVPICAARSARMTAHSIVHSTVHSAVHSSAAPAGIGCARCAAWCDPRRSGERWPNGIAHDLGIPVNCQQRRRIVRVWRAAADIASAMMARMQTRPAGSAHRIGNFSGKADATQAHSSLCGEEHTPG